MMLDYIDQEPAEIIEEEALFDYLERSEVALSLSDREEILNIAGRGKMKVDCLVTALEKLGVKEEFDNEASLFFLQVLEHMKGKKLNFEIFLEQMAEKSGHLENNLVDLSFFTVFLEEEGIFKGVLPYSIKKRVIYGSNVKILNFRERFFAFCSERSIYPDFSEEDEDKGKKEKKVFKREGTMFGVVSSNQVQRKKEKAATIKENEEEEGEMFVDRKEIARKLFGAEEEGEGETVPEFGEDNDFFRRNVKRMTEKAPKVEVEPEEAKQPVKKPNKSFHAALSIINVAAKEEDKPEIEEEKPEDPTEQLKSDTFGKEEGQIDRAEEGAESTPPSQDRAEAGRKRSSALSMEEVKKDLDNQEDIQSELKENKRVSQEFVHSLIEQL